MLHVARLALVVVFDNHEVVYVRRLHQGVATLERHGDSGRYLVAGRDVGNVNIRQGIVDDQSMLIDRPWHNLRIVIFEQFAHDEIARLFHCNDSLFLGEQLTDQIQTVLRAHRDQDLIRKCLDASTRQDLGSNLL